MSCEKCSTAFRMSANWIRSCEGRGICKIFYTSKIPKFFNFSREKRVNRDIFVKNLRIEEALLIMYFEQIVSFYANTKSFHFFCEKSSRNLANFTDRVIFCAKYWKYFHKCHLWLLRQIPRLVKVDERWHSLETFESESLESSQKCFSYVDSCRNSC